ncbi:hypothetical protein [Consotaella salsifontis]|uniref:Uncharacterized protein n=1 Tax=Consotaella salsifontis TaxID=1365950 RepID=A0A1T4R5I6_9HYPH|nr:hypothetical protein [Consotaella salsifontis]SKA11189.1 hypothetical protein SAMN05428963_10637 [Consotaella salsifontis]
MAGEEYYLRRIEVWLSIMDSYLQCASQGRPPELEKLADSFSDPVVREWVLERSDPRRIRGAVNHVRACYRAGKLATALERIERFDAERQHVKDLLNRPDLVRGRTTVASAASGGKARSLMFEGTRSRIVNEMRTLVDKGKTVSSAGKIVFNKGLGTSGEANRTLWYRHLGRKL